MCKASVLLRQLVPHVQELHLEEFENAFVEEEKQKGSKKGKEMLETPRSHEVVRKEANDFKEEEINSLGLKAKKSSVNNKYYCGREIKYNFPDKVRGLPTVCQTGESGDLN